MPHRILPYIRAAMLCLATGVSACGGGSEAPAPTLSVGVSITAPAAADQVFSLGTPVAVGARVTVNGAPAPDGSCTRRAATGGKSSMYSGPACFRSRSGSCR